MRHTVKSLLKMARYYRDNPGGTVQISWSQTMDAGQFRQWFIESLNAKIDRDTPSRTAWRNMTREYKIELERMRAYAGNRVIVDWIAPVLGRRVRAAFADRMRGAA